MMDPEAQGVDKRVAFITQRLQMLQQMQKMAASSGQGGCQSGACQSGAEGQGGHGHSHGGGGGHGHSHGGEPCDGHSHDPARMNMILQRMQKFMAMQAQGGEKGEFAGTETQTQALQAMQMMKQIQSNMMNGGGMMGAGGGGVGGYRLGMPHPTPTGISYHSQTSDGESSTQSSASSTTGGAGHDDSFESKYPAPRGDREEENSKMEKMSGEVAANAPHRQKNWVAYIEGHGLGPKESFLHGGGHFSPPEFGWGELIKNRDNEHMEKITQGNKAPVQPATGGLMSQAAFQMPHQTPTTGRIIHTTLPIVGRIRFLTDKQGLVFWTIVVLYWILGNYSTWFCILLPQYNDGHLPFFFLIPYAAVSILCITSHLRASTMNPGKIPYFVEENSIDHPDWSFCHQCQRKRPPRAHHCRRCQQCVLKMDHHCPWINNCVGEENQWVFILLVIYANLLSSFTLGFNILYYYKLPACQSCDPMSFAIFHQRALINTVTVMAILMILFSLGLVCSQNMGVLMDYTTLEWMQMERAVTSTGKMPDPDDLPKMKNVCRSYRSLCGDTFFLFWPFPCRRRIAPVLKRMEDV